MTGTTRTAKLLATAAAAFALAQPIIARAATAVEPVAPKADEPDLLHWDIASVIWVLGIFLVVFFILKQTAWKNILAGLTAREKRIRGDIADAEAARAKAEASLVEYNKTLATAETQVRELLATAATDAERIATTIKMRAQQDAEEAKEKATKEIEASKQRALADIYEQAATLATTVAEKILKREINADDQKALVDESLKQLQAANG